MELIFFQNPMKSSLFFFFCTEVAHFCDFLFFVILKNKHAIRQMLCQRQWKYFINNYFKLSEKCSSFPVRKDACQNTFFILSPRSYIYCYSTQFQTGVLRYLRRSKASDRWWVVWAACHSTEFAVNYLGLRWPTKLHSTLRCNLNHLLRHGGLSRLFIFPVYPMIEISSA